MRGGAGVRRGEGGVMVLELVFNPKPSQASNILHTATRKQEQVLPAHVQGQSTCLLRLLQLTELEDNCCEVRRLLRQRGEQFCCCHHDKIEASPPSLPIE